METKTITIRVNAKVARAFEAASEEQQQHYSVSNLVMRLDAKDLWKK
ncbi:hypothetical protein [Synechococcus sp. PCC 6312]|nr:hypothetical protein [Synechococcus sp. PCC 6312]AFY59919.1 hypothetical protein Syn6312_0699 [Synechococcus sp. PCC 6312]